VEKRHRMLSHRQSSKPRECEIPRVRVYAHEIQLIAEEAVSWPNRETGGHVFGYWDNRGNAIGHFFSGPGPHAVHEYAHFEEDAEFLQLTYAQANHLHGADLVMRVHSHHGLGLTGPSPGDARSQASLMARNGFRRMVELIVTFSGANAPDKPTRSEDESCLHVRIDGPRPTGRRNERLGRDCGASDPVEIRMHGYFHEPLNGGYSPCAISLLPGVSPLREALFGMTEEKLGLESVAQRRGLKTSPQRCFSEGENANCLAKVIVQLKQECASLPPAVREACEYIPSDDFVVVKIPARGKKLLVAYRPEPRVRVEAIYLQLDDNDAPLLNITTDALGRNGEFSLIETLRAVQDHAWPHGTSAPGLSKNNLEVSNHDCPESRAAGEMFSPTENTFDAVLED